MASSQSGAAPRGKPEAHEASSTTQQVVSLLLVLHLFCVLIAISSYTRRSALQARLLELLAPYTLTLNLAPSVAPFHLTQYDALLGENPQDDENFLELEITRPNGEVEVHNLNELALPFPDARRRYRTLASEMVYSLGEGAENEYRLSELARAAGRFGLERFDADAGVLRLQHHLSQPRLLENLQAGFPEDPTAPQYLSTRYEADVLLDDDGEVQLIKREDKAQVAPVRSATPPSAASGKKDS